ncbi:MAG: hypothetical protein N2038_06860 [Geminicoccaceae bacterium]|nr:hypothetical protein [Geminicoccaceae bacterium]MCS7267141.1 hypothetical protein [Geminicoccaceae bacterium]MCX7629955.1 hypothetical protein [Geminicoccaceae bacterium]MDW8125726.1 hypothetical protein [Geminicoccaceae bacterium]MDW8342681.1 hypothetical protein [Geminicoccaceae bacterium]
MRRRTCLALVALPIVAFASARAAESPLQRVFGTWVGSAELFDETGALLEQRDLDLLVEPFRRSGFRLRTISVTLVGGRRDRPGVVRRETEVAFVPAGDRPYFVEERGSNPFREREELQAMAGDPVRWAVVDDQGLHLYAFVLLEDGRFELQVTHRRPTPEGLELDFVRIRDGRVVRRARGRLIRVD